ncbi:MAG TPA: LuxR C-terminal-related transcriptional regulator [Candidatus Limnocylindrales bacterium]|jgi:DNA-binding CsgD family transcriptional regulator
MNATRTVQSPILVGRDEHLVSADQWIADAAAGHGRFVLFAGETGVGKTRLLRSILMKARSAGFRLAKGDVNPQDAHVLLFPVHDLARTMGQDDFGNLAERILAVDPTRDRGPARSHRLLVRDLVEMILDAIDRPTVLAFEDLQWVDEMTLEVIGELARGAVDRPLLMIGDFRHDELPRGSIHREWRSRLVTQRLAEEVRLPRLDREQTGVITTLLMGTGLPAPREVVDAVYRRTNGIPLHIEELLTAVRDSSTIDANAILEVSVPETIEDAVLAHAGRLSADAFAVARAGSIFGRCFTPDVLAGVLNRPVADLDEPLRELVDDGLVFPFEFIDKGYFDFRHQLLRDAIYSSVPARDLRRFHGRAAEFIPTLIGGNEIHASVHFERAGMRDEAFRTALDGAEAAMRVTSHREALDLFKRALHNMPGSLPDREKGRILLGASDAAGNLDRVELCRDYAIRAREHALQAGDRGRAAEALLNQYVMARRALEPIADQRHLARQFALEVEALPEGVDRVTMHLNSLWALAHVEMDALNLREARGLLEEMRTAAAAAGADADLHEALADLARIDIIEGRVAEGLAAIRSIADAARALGAEGPAVNCYRDAAMYAIRSLEFGQARERIDDGMRYADQVEQSHCGHMMASASALIAWGDGRWADAEDLGRQAVSDQGSLRAKAVANWALGYTAAGRGDRQAAEEYLRPAVEVGRRGDWLEMLLPALWGMAEAALASGDAATAAERADEALQLARERGEWALLAPFAVTGVRAHQAAGQPEAAARYLDRLLRAIGPAKDIAAPAIDHATGLVKLADGATGMAREFLEKAVAGWDARGRLWEALWARLDLASADLRSNRYAEAMKLVREVRGRAEAIGSRPLVARADELERLAKGRGAELEPWHPLTTREFEVAKKIAEGLTNAQIGEELFVSPKTVSAHVEHILAKLGVARRTEIATWVASIALPHSAPAPSSELASAARR